jgi:hypothetical protein
VVVVSSSNDAAKSAYTRAAASSSRWVRAHPLVSTLATHSPLERSRLAAYALALLGFLLVPLKGRLVVRPQRERLQLGPVDRLHPQPPHGRARMAQRPTDRQTDRQGYGTDTPTLAWAGGTGTGGGTGGGRPPPVPLPPPPRPPPFAAMLAHKSRSL